MAPDLKAVSFRLEEELLAGLQRVKDREGIPVTEQVRRAIQDWLRAKGEFPPTATGERRRGIQGRGRARKR